MTKKLQSSFDRAPSTLLTALLLLIGILWAGGSGLSAAGESFVIVINAQSPLSTLAVKEVSALFLKKKTMLPDGTKAKPVDLAESVFSREGFSNRVHHKTTAAIRAYWQQMIFSGREVPPPQKGAPQEVVAFVRTNRGGIGYVPAGTPLGEGVKVLSLKP
jgi:hypothetical protein